MPTALVIPLTHRFLSSHQVKRTLRHFWKRRMAARRGGRRRSNRSTSLFDNPSLPEATRRQSGFATRLRPSLDSRITIAPAGRRRDPLPLPSAPPLPYPDYPDSVPVTVSTSADGPCL